MVCGFGLEYIDLKLIQRKTLIFFAVLKHIFFSKFVICCLISNSYAEIARNTEIPRKLVFAHYMVCCPAAGGSATMEDYMTEIQDAQTRGIDGFALNSGRWVISEPIYKKRALLIYQAADKLNTGFKLFISVDGKAKDELENIINDVKNLPNQLKVNGRPVVSTFGGDPNPAQDDEMLIIRAKRAGAFFIPYFFPRPVAKELPSVEDVKDLANRYRDLDGFFYFGAAGTGDQISESNANNATVWRQRGKIFMASVTPYYLGAGSNYRVFETEGFKGMASEWEGAIKNDVDWVEIVTWNDWYESSYIAPFVIKKPNFANNQLPNSLTLPHSAYLDASRYYIDWFKMGKKPKIIHDQLYYFYRLHPKSEDALISLRGEKDYGKPKGVGSLKDNVFVTAFLKSPGQVTIYSGTTYKTFNLPTGVSQIEMPFKVGKQQFILRRNTKVVVNKVGERKISAKDTMSRFNYFSGSAVK